LVGWVGLKKLDPRTTLKRRSCTSLSRSGYQ